MTLIWNCVRSLVIILSVLLWTSIGDDQGASCDSHYDGDNNNRGKHDDVHCHEEINTDNNGDVIWDDKSCYSKVLLLEGYPDNEMTPHRTSSLVQTTTQELSSNTLDEVVESIKTTGSSFSKISRYSTTEMDASNFTNDRHFLHISPNGDHEGWFIFVPHNKCVKVAKQLIAREIIALQVSSYDNLQVLNLDLHGPHRLVNEEGKMITDPIQMTDEHSNTTGRRLHLLLPRETFVHQAVSEGFVRTMSDGKTTLTTLSLAPRVFVIDPIISKEQCNEIIQYASDAFYRSIEHHYSDEFKNYRTSLSARTPSKSKAAQYLHQRVKDITAVPPGGVERPQPLKYETNTSWYKVHMDYFHAYQNKPLEEVRMYVKVRIKELLRLNLLPSDLMKTMFEEQHIKTIDSAQSSSNSLVDDLLTQFDNPIEWPMHRNIAQKMIKSLGLTSSNDERGGHDDERIILHNYLYDSQNPRYSFERVAIQYASLFLEYLENAGGSSGTVKDEGNVVVLARTYFRVFGHHTILDNDGQEPDIQDYVPYVYKPIETNRHVTVLPILQAANRGGHTAFPKSKFTRLSIDPDPGEHFEECQHGLILKPTAGQALMFYNRLPGGQLDPMSEHAGCPPMEGEKFAANCFTWDSDQSWAWKFHQPLDELYW